MQGMVFQCLVQVHAGDLLGAARPAVMPGRFSGDAASFMPVDPLAGALRHTLGIIALVSLARERGLHTAYVPPIDAREATLLGGALRGGARAGASGERSVRGQPFRALAPATPVRELPSGSGCADSMDRVEWEHDGGVLSRTY